MLLPVTKVLSAKEARNVVLRSRIGVPVEASVSECMRGGFVGFVVRPLDADGERFGVGGLWDFSRQLERLLPLQRAKHRMRHRSVVVVVVVVAVARWVVGLGRVRCRSRTNEAQRRSCGRPPQATPATRMRRSVVTYGRKGSKRSHSTTDSRTENTERSPFDRPRKRSRVSDDGSSASGDNNSKFSRQNLQ